MISALLVSALCGSICLPEDHREQALAALAAGDLGRAWSELEQEADTFSRESTRVRVCHEAGDLAGVLHYGQLALSERPADLEVLFFTAWANVSLRLGEGAEGQVQRLGESIEEASLATAELEYWSRVLGTLEHEVGELLRIESERARKVALARAVALSALLLASSLLVWTSIRSS